MIFKRNCYPCCSLIASIVCSLIVCLPLNVLTFVKTWFISRILWDNLCVWLSNISDPHRLHSFPPISLCTRTISAITSPLSTWTSCWPVSSGRRWRRRSKVGPSPNQGSELRGASKAPTQHFIPRLEVRDSNTGRTFLRRLTHSSDLVTSAKFIWLLSHRTLMLLVFFFRSI